MSGAAGFVPDAAVVRGASAVVPAGGDAAAGVAVRGDAAVVGGAAVVPAGGDAAGVAVRGATGVRAPLGVGDGGAVQPGPATATGGAAAGGQSGVAPSAAAGSAAAAKARQVRADVKRQMEFSSESLRNVLALGAQPSGAAVRRMPVVELLAAMPGLGQQRAQELAAQAGVAPGRRLGGLGHLQAQKLGALIDERAARRRLRRCP